MKRKNETAVLILSCDAYSDLWPFVTHLYRRYWPDCPFDIFLGSQHKEVTGPGIITVKSGSAGAWSDDVIVQLQQIGAEYVLLTLDDFFLRSRVDTAILQKHICWAATHGADYLRLAAFPPGVGRVPGNTNIGYCRNGSRYGVSLQAAIWRRERLLELLRPGESAWQFEQSLHARLEKDFSAYSVRRTIFPYMGLFSHHVVQRGMWLATEKIIFQRRAPGISFGNRRVMSWRDAGICVITKYLLAAGYWLGEERGDKIRQMLWWTGRCILGRRFYNRLGFRED